jgi:hypothetical protein
MYVLAGAASLVLILEHDGASSRRATQHGCERYAFSDAYLTVCFVMHTCPRIARVAHALSWYVALCCVITQPRRSVSMCSIAHITQPNWYTRHGAVHRTCIAVSNLYLYVYLAMLLAGSSFHSARSVDCALCGVSSG